MKIALYGASGVIGNRIAQEALSRGHQVTALARHPEKIALRHERLQALAGDASDAAGVARTAQGHDAVVSAISPDHANPQTVVGAYRALLEGMRKAGVRRLVVVGGAGSLEVAPGKQLVDQPDFPAAWKPSALAHRDVLAVVRDADLDWTYFSPAAFIEPGVRTGKYRTGTEQLLVDSKGPSRISTEDYAVALLDELEKPKFLRKRFTAAY